MASHSIEKIKDNNFEDAGEPSFFVAQKPINDEFEGRYEILEEIGQGGMGVVYKARQPALQKLYAIKMLHSVHIKETILRFEREAKAISKLDHPNLITSHDFGVSTDGRPFMVMDFIEGTSLAQLIEKNRKLPLRQALEICVQIARGMAYAHAQGVLHRDLKPGNIMLVTQPDGKTLVKIIDFGIAKVVETAESSSLTRTGDVFGSPYYMSPEQAVGRGIDERSDIYSLGCVMYEMLTGVLPFRGASAFETLYAHMNERAPTLKLNAIKEQFPAPIEKLVAKSLAKNQSDRWQSMTELEYELNSVLKVLDSPFHSLFQHLDFEGSKGGKSKVWFVVPVIALAVTCVVGAISFWPVTQVKVHEQPEQTATEYLKDQKLDDPNELAKPIIQNGSSVMSLEGLDCNDDAMKWFKDRHDVVKLDLSGTSVADGGTQHLTHLPLQTLKLNKTGVADLVYVAKIPTLEHLELNSTYVTNMGVNNLTQLPNLIELSVQDDRLTDSAVDAISKLSKLEGLAIGNNPEITDEAVSKLSELKNLRVLHLTNLRVGDEAFENIDQLKNLKKLDLTGTHVSDKILEKLSRMQLHELHLNGTDVSDKGILALKDCTTLHRLTLGSCPKVTGVVVKELRKSLPHCKVSAK